MCSPCGSCRNGSWVPASASRRWHLSALSWANDVGWIKLAYSMVGLFLQKNGVALSCWIKRGASLPCVFDANVAADFCVQNGNEIDCWFFVVEWFTFWWRKINFHHGYRTEMTRPRSENNQFVFFENMRSIGGRWTTMLFRKLSCYAGWLPRALCASICDVHHALFCLCRILLIRCDWVNT